MQLESLSRRTAPSQTHERMQRSPISASRSMEETRLDDGLFSILERNEPANEKDLAKQHRFVGIMVHLALQSVENFTTLYLKLNDFIIGTFGEAENSTQQEMISSTNNGESTS